MRSPHFFLFVSFFGGWRPRRGTARRALRGLTRALFLAGRYQKAASSVVASASFPRASLTKNLGSALSQHNDTIAELSAIAVMCCFTPKSGPWNSVVECPLCAKNGLMQCSKISRYSIASSATASSFGEIRSAPPCSAVRIGFLHWWYGPRYRPKALEQYLTFELGNTYLSEVKDVELLGPNLCYRPAEGQSAGRPFCEVASWLTCRHRASRHLVRCLPLKEFLCLMVASTVLYRSIVHPAF